MVPSWPTPDAQNAMSSKPRANSLFVFRKHYSLNSSCQSNDKLSSLSMDSFRPGTFSRTSSLSGRSSSPGRGNTESSVPTSCNLQASSNVSLSSISSELGDTLTSRLKENVFVTIRFRPLSSREIKRGDKLAWCADGDTFVKSTLCAATAYAFDRVFGPTTPTRQVYEAAAQHVVKGAMEGVNGTVFAYGVTSSGKTHTMHGDQSGPGIIPLAIENVFTIIQEKPEQDFLLRVSYLEIYNEVINDLLNPGGQNLRIREDAQGTYVEGLKEEVVLSPAHCLSLIAAGEEHRHVGSNNINLLSSRSHTIFTLTIESSPGEGALNNAEVSLSQLNLIDLAGSESSKTETTGLRRKEGSYINKSLLTLGTVISKLSDGKATHIPYRDSKLTRLLQSSLSGHGRISLICTVTPATSTNEETHNTLKFAHRAKEVEVHAFPNKIMDEKSLIKKYQKEIQRLKHELEQLKRKTMEISQLRVENKEDFTSLKQQMEAGQGELQTRLEEEEQVKTALLERIQRLTRFILVSMKDTASQSLLERLAHRRRHSFGEETDHGISLLSIDSDSSSNVSSAASASQGDTDYDPKARHNSVSSKVDDSSSLDCLDSPQTGSTVAYQMDLLREQVKILAGEVTFCTSSLKRLSEQAALSSDDDQIQAAESTELQKIVTSLQEQRATGKENSALPEVAIAQLQAASSLDSREAIDYMLISRRVFETSGCTDNAQTEDLNTSNVDGNGASELQLQLLKKKMQIEKLEIERDQLREERDAFQAQSLTVAEEASYARDLASAAAVELRNLAQEVKKLSAQNNKLAAELAIARERAYSRAGYSGVNELFVASIATDRSEKYRMDATNSEETFYDDLSKDLLVRQEREAAFGSLVAEKALNQVEVWHRMEKAKRTEMDLENELTGMWVLASSLKKSIDSDDSIRTSFQGFPSLSDHLKNMDCMGDEYKYGTESMDFEDLLKEEGHNRAEPQTLVAQLKSEDLEELDLNSLEDLCALHVNALTRLRQAKAKVQKKLSKNRSECSLMGPEQCEDRHAHVCRVCSRVLMSALLLPCCHVSLCRLCAAACTDCPLCKHPIPDKLFLHFGE